MNGSSGLTVIYLTGFMGSGKSTAGRALAGRLGRPFIDLDDQIESREGCSAARLFAQSGEAAFREAERRALEALPLEICPVVATGGGIVLSRENLCLMARTGLRVWLNCPLAEIVRRLESTSGERERRPLWSGGLEGLGRLLEQRTPAYASADLTVDAAGTVDRTVEQILRWLEGRAD